MSFPAFSGLFASLMAAAAAAPDEIPTCNKHFSLIRNLFSTKKKKEEDIMESEEQLPYQQTFF